MNSIKCTIKYSIKDTFLRRHCLLLPPTQEDEAGAAGDPPPRRQEPVPAVQREDVRPLPETPGQVLELGGRVLRLQPPHLQPVPRGRDHVFSLGDGADAGVEVYRLSRLQVAYRLHMGLTQVPAG
jgi:hypothetical protein